MTDRLEGTNEFQRGFEMRQPTEERQIELAKLITAKHIMQQIIAENPRDPDLDWIVFQRAGEIEEENVLPLGVTADDVYDEFVRMYEDD